MRTEGVFHSRDRKKGYLVLVFPAAVVLMLVFLLPFLRQQEQAYRYQTTRVTRDELVVTVTADGNLRAKDHVGVGTEISGTVREVKADFNHRVREGHVLARLDTEKIEAELKGAGVALKSAKATLEQTRVDYERAYRKLRQLKEAYELSGVRTPALSEVQEQEVLVDRLRAQLSFAEAEVEAAKAAVRLREAEFEKASIRSPIDGVILSGNVEAGQTVVASLQSPTLFVIAKDLR